jgi:hypothetical protein
MNARRISPPWLFLLLLLTGCAGRTEWETMEHRVLSMGYSIQVGAFSEFDNAVRLAARLEERGLSAIFFRDDDGLNKVRFGNYSSRQEAAAHAERLYSEGLIDEFYIVSPEQYANAQRELLGDAFVRDRLVQTAKQFLDLPYRWGGASTVDGFDCSGLTMTVYRLNGLNLPRTSDEQFQAGFPISVDALQKGDLLFFGGGFFSGVSHVGIYIGNGKFIHAPGTGKTIRVSDLLSNYSRRNFVGARSYL